MDFRIDPSDTAAASASERFCQQHLAPRAKSVDADSCIPRQNRIDLHDVGVFKIHYLEIVRDLDVSWEVRAKGCAPTFLSTGASIGWFGAPFFAYGSRPQKERWFAPLLNNEIIGCSGDSSVERLYCDARLGPIGEGRSEIQRDLIARELLDG